MKRKEKEISEEERKKEIGEEEKNKQATKGRGEVSMVLNFFIDICLDKFGSIFIEITQNFLLELFFTIITHFQGYNQNVVESPCSIVARMFWLYVNKWLILNRIISVT